MEPHESPSIVESPREAEIAAIQAQAEIANAKQKQEQQKEKRRKTIKILVIVLVSLFFAAVAVALVWFIIVVVFSLTRRPVDDPVAVDPPADVVYEIIEGYQCTTSSCSKVIDLPDGRFIAQDSNVYYIYNPEDDSTVRTTIPEQRYQTIVPFVWGEEILAELEPDTGRSALYSITRNTQLTNFNYDIFYTDPEAPEYQNMTWIIGSYIIAKQGASFRLIDVFNGAEIVQATLKVFAYNPYFFAYNENGERRVYTSTGSQILIASSSDHLYIRDGYLIYLTANSKTSFKLYNAEGTELRSDNAYFKSLREALKNQKDYATAIPQLSGTYTVPQQ